MSRLIEIGSLRIGLPELGMPIINPPEVSRSSRINGMDVAVPSAVLLPTGGMGFFGWPAIAGHRDGRHFTLQFGEWTHTSKGKNHVFEGHDQISAVDITLTIIQSSKDVFSMGCIIANCGLDDYTLDRCMAASVLIAEGNASITSFAGTWGREFQMKAEPLGRGVWLQENRRGRTSHDKSPGIIVNVGSQSWRLHLGWSGNHVIVVDVLDDGRRLAHLGELFEPGEVRLKPGESYTSPKAYFTSSPVALPEFVRNRLLSWSRGVMRTRPVTLNTWEGNYFDHRLDDLKAQADAAADLGIERFVLDDGWFGRRDGDTSSLGDWFVDERKYPDGLKPLIEHVISRGMEFGIWFEPEMVNPESDLYRANPDWVLQVEGRPLLLSRNQLVLDLTRKEVSDYLFKCMDKVLKAHKITYIKWDMNRDLTHVGGADGQARTSRQTRAVYALMDRLRASYPDLEIETCASGGGRSDYGVLERTQRIWTSDCTDALERLEIQRGARVFFPPEILGSHISTSPNHQTHRCHTLAFRAIVAMAYHFGVELNPVALTGEEREELKGWITLHKKLRPLLHSAPHQFHLNPEDGRYVWGAECNNRIVVIIAQGGQMVSEQPPPLTLNLKEAKAGRWRIAAVHPEKPDFIRTSPTQQSWLAGATDFDLHDSTKAGFSLPMLRPESGAILELERIEGV